MIEMHQVLGGIESGKLHELLGFREPMLQSQETLNRSYLDWEMVRDDVPILRYLLRNAAPRRHLEFGTWQGQGVLCCLEETAATVWTINLPEGESQPDGSWAYSTTLGEGETQPPFSESRTFDLLDGSGGSITWFRTDALGFIGKLYLERGLGHRVCQIYCDSTQWDDSNYPDGFFDTAFIDGGHTPEIVASDTRKALRLVRPGGLIIWHDYNQDPEVLKSVALVRDVTEGVAGVWEELERGMASLNWIRRSYLLLGVRR